MKPQKCPRCESLNTKFCYYNNYSLSQPRYLCKACRRYWTHGGTLRNVRIGGGCRKPKRAKTSASSSSVVAPPPLPPPPPLLLPTIDSFYHGGGGFLSSLAPIQPQPFNQMVGGTDLGFLSDQYGVPSIHPPQLYPIRDYEADPGLKNIQVAVSAGHTGGSVASGHDCTENLITITNNNNNPVSETTMWSTSTTMSTTSSTLDYETANNPTVSASFPMMPNPHWPDLPPP